MTIEKTNQPGVPMTEDRIAAIIDKLAKEQHEIDEQARMQQTMSLKRQNNNSDC